MAENFRKAKIQKYYDSLKVRADGVKERLEKGVSSEIVSSHHEGFLLAIEMIMSELEVKFDLSGPNNPNPDISK